MQNYIEWKDSYKAKFGVFKGISSLKYTSDLLPLRALLGDKGNSKLPSTTAIFNMTPATTCPSKRLGLCKAAKQGANCYALKAEYLYPEVLPYRKNQEKLWKKITAKDFAFQFLMINATKKNPFSLLRMNESGDFNDQSDVDKAEKIARILKTYGIRVYLYTSRDDLDYSHVEALRISGSGFKKEGIVNVFKIIKSKKDRPSGYGMCAMSCRICDRCSRSRMNTCVIKH